MDPLLKALSDDQLRGLVSEQRPEWAVPLGQGRPEVSEPLSEGGPPLPPQMQQLRGRAAQAYEYGQDPLNRKAPFIKQAIEAIIALGDPRARAKLPKPYDVAEGFLNPVSGMAGVLVGARAAKNIGGLAEGKFHAGVQALERGEAPQAVWRQWGVAKNAEGKYVFEPALQMSESDALRQFEQLYPDVALKVYRGGGAREGWYDPKTGELYARGKTDVPITDFQSRRRVLEHELQHKADDLEGMSYGTKLEDPTYWDNAAEVRARAVEQRLDPKERVWEPSFHEDVDRMQQIIKKHPGAVSEAVKEKGGMWHPEAVDRLALPLQQSMTRGEGAELMRDQLAGEAGNWPLRAIRNYLNKHAGTATDPLRDVEIPFGEGVKRWEDLWDNTVVSAQAQAMQGRARDTADIWSGFEGVEKAKPTEPIFNFGDFTGGPGNRGSQQAITSYLSHVGDYLRQNVAPEKLAQYDLVRAVKETVANDARVAKEMEKAAQASMKDLPVYKEYPQGFKWVELRKPEALTESQAKSVRKLTPEESQRNNVTGYVAIGADGKPLKNAYTDGLVTARTPEEAYLAGQLAQEGNQMGHCVGGYCEGVASGQSRIMSLRDAKGRSHVTVELVPGGGGPGDIIGPDQFHIVQIKGKQNRAPNAEYLPYVQDFVRSGKWGEVGDLGNSGLTNVGPGQAIPWDRMSGSSYDMAQRALKRYGDADSFLKAVRDITGGSNYITKEAFEEAVKKLGIVSELPRLNVKGPRG